MLKEKLESRNKQVDGINVIGNFHGQFGLAHTARQMVAILEKEKIPFVLIDSEGLPALSNHPLATHYAAEPKYEINLFCVDVNAYFRFFCPRIWRLMKSRYNIALCFWESNRIPQSLKRPLGFFEEIWVMSAYVKESVSHAVSVPIHYIPHVIPNNSINPSITKSDFGLPNRFTFLFCFNFFSSAQRKNPLAIIQAFRKAFPKRSDVQLVIKSQNGSSVSSEYLPLIEEVKNDTRIYWLDGPMPFNRLGELMGISDCYVSLHRSEGFGLTMAEAMSIEKPVIATRYSGNLDFMNEANSFLCRYKLVPIGTSKVSYPAHSVWADADIDQAAFWMNYVIDHPKEAAQKACKGREHILKFHSFEVAGNYVVKRLQQIEPDLKNRSYKIKQKKIEVLSYLFLMKILARDIYRATKKLLTFQ